MELGTARQPHVRVARARLAGPRVARARLAGPHTARPRLAGLVASALTAGLALAPALPAGAAARGRGTIGGPQLAGHGVIVNYPSARAIPLPEVKASAYVVADAGTGQVLAAKDPHGWYLPASTLKVLTAITMMPVLNPDATVLTTRRAAGAEPSKVGLIAGDSYRVADLFKAMLLISANDAAMSVAQATGSVARGVAILHCKPPYELAYAARLLDWGFGEDGKVKPVGVLVPPLPAHTVAHHQAKPQKPQALPPLAKLGLPGIPLLAGLGTIALAGLTAVTMVVISRRGRREGSPPGR